VSASVRFFSWGSSNVLEHVLPPPSFPHADASLTLVQTLLHTHDMGPKLMYLSKNEEPSTRRPPEAVALCDDVTVSVSLQREAIGGVSGVAPAAEFVAFVGDAAAPECRAASGSTGKIFTFDAMSII
jgi:hypothetical protein